MQCPHCNKPLSPKYINLAERNVDNYGSCTFVIPCVHCKGNIRISLDRTVVWRRIDKADIDDEPDWG